ncbi:DNA polymerase III subunit alpha [Listeria sp. PSOL-1]|uniref:DNA polymerase III subunit alpha n=1 Tax=Listeria sp. PSOL-1 TaxID=1844999 RepID=UPI0013D106E2|nr:DNA polymerase III subunit alpha [Listeria sp. PSOL-1]
MGFVHLQVASAYDLLSSTAQIDRLIKKAKEANYQALAITDKNALYGALEFYQKCLAADIKPIIGITITIPGIINPLKSYELVLLAETDLGYHQLLKIASAIQTREDKQELPLEWLASYKEGLIALTPGVTGELEDLLLEENESAAKEVFTYFKQLFGVDHFYLTLQKDSPDLAQKMIRFADKMEMSLVASKNVHYLHARDVQSFHILEAIRDNTTVDWMNLPLVGSAYFATPDEMAQQYTTEIEKKALLETERIAARCHVEIKLDQHLLPRFPLQENEKAEEVLYEIAFQGLKERRLHEKEYVQRLEYELDIINKMGFADYFLIIWDVMKYARKNEILTGPGRGSAAGSLVSYVLQITDVDPIRYQLLFERFLNPERITMPDIDLDFPDNRRDDIISYVVSKYGSAHVAQIGTFGTLAAKAAIRDTARTFGLNTIELAEWAKQIPNQLGITLEKAKELNPKLDYFIHSTKQNEMIWEIATQIEGLPRHISTHAAGIVISDRPLVEQIPLQNGSGDAFLTQYAMGDLEKIGLLKMDFLGLRNLSLLDRVLRSVNYHRDLKLSIRDIPLDDEKTLKLFRSGDTTGVFQFESDGIRRVLRHLKPTRFEDIVAVDALYRPGPMEQIDTFIARKQGKEAIHYPHPDLKSILAVTYGVIVYQEQIMQVASQMAGFTLGEADLLRRAVSKKKADVLNEQRQFFVTGAKKKGYAEESANAVYDMIVRFANYGFNRSHAAAYSKIAFQLAYLKAHFPAEFMAALLSSVFGNDTKISQYITEAKKYQIEMLPPSINKSHLFFQVEGNSAIRYSFRIIRKVSNKFIEAILEERQKNGSFHDFFTFCERMPAKMLNETVLEALIYSGAFDEFGKDRATLQNSIQSALNYEALLGSDEGKINLFEGDDVFLPKPRYKEITALTEDIKLEYEKEYTGQYVSAHPINQYKDQLDYFKATPIVNVKKGKVYQIGAYVHDKKVIRTKKGEAMCFLTISDNTKETSAVLFPESYRKFGEAINKGDKLFLKVKIDQRNGELQAIVQEAISLNELIVPKRLFLKMTGNVTLDEIKAMLITAKGENRVIVHHADTKQTIELQQKFAVDGTEPLLRELKQLLGDENVILK